MTITIDNPDIESRLVQASASAGLDVSDFILQVLADRLPAEGQTHGLKPGESLLDGLKRIGAVGAFQSKPRSDGRPWSTIEGYEFE